MKSTKKSTKRLTQNDDTITIEVENTVNKPPNPVIIYVNESATLSVTLTNNTGSAITLGSDSSIEIYMPMYFTTAEVKGMKIKTPPSGWSFSYSSQDVSLMLKYSESGTWAKGTSLTFDITNILTKHQPDTGGLQCNFNMKGSNIPSQVTAKIILMNPPVPGNASLPATLDVWLENGDTVYVSDTEDSPLSNNLYLTLTNIGKDPIYNGSAKWQSAPKVKVSFVYGNTSGSLEPVTGSPPLTAWDIEAAVSASQGNAWGCTNPSDTGGHSSPSWTLSPSPSDTNKDIIGTGDAASITFEFSNIISFTPEGTTLMYVQFTGFMKDENTNYDDYVLAVTITKQNPPIPGVIGIWSSLNTLSVSYSAQIPIPSVPLTWPMLNVGSVKLSFSISGSGLNIDDQKFSYSDKHPVLNYDTQQINLGITTPPLYGNDLVITCSAYSDTNCMDSLNKEQYILTLAFGPPVVNSFTGSFDYSSSTPVLNLNWTTEGATGVIGSWKPDEETLSNSHKVSPPFKGSYTVTPVDARTNKGTTSSLIADFKQNIDNIHGFNCPRSVAISPDGSFALVTNDYGNKVSIIKKNNGTFTKASDIAGFKTPFSVAISPHGSFALVCNYGGKSVSIIKKNNGTITKASDITGFTYPNSVAISPDGSFALVTNDYGNKVSIIRINNGTFTSADITGLNLNGSPSVAISPDGSFALVCSYNSVSIIKKNNGTFTKASDITGFTTSNSVAISPDGSFALVCNYGSASVSIIRNNNGTFTKETSDITGFKTPNSVAISPDGSFALVCDYGGNSVSVLGLTVKKVAK